MQLLIAFAAIVAVAAASSSGSSCQTISVPSVISSVASQLPLSLETEIAQAYSHAADILSIGTIISTIALSSPTLTYAEGVIASYEESYSSVISYIESIYSSPSLLPPSSQSSFSQLTSIHSTLAGAINEIVSIEQSHYSLASVQRTLESIEATQPSIMTYLDEYTAVASPSIYYATEVIEEATVTSSSILPTFVEVYTAVQDHQAVSYALSSLSALVYQLPSTIVSEVISYIDSPSTVSPGILSSLSSCYASVYADVTSVVEFTYSHTSVVSAITDLLYAESTVSDLGTAIYTVIVSEWPTLIYQTNVLSGVSYTLPSVYTYVEYLSYLEATSPTLSDAISTIEETFYESPSVAISLYDDLFSPSLVTSLTQVHYEKISHQSFVSALDDVTEFENANPSLASTVDSILCALTTAFETQRTLLTAVAYVTGIVSPSYSTAGSAISDLISVVSDIPQVVSYFNSVIADSPTLSCYESIIESSAYYYPYYVEQLWSVFESPSVITSSFSNYSYMEDEYSTVAYAIEAMVAAESSFPSLSSYEYSFILAASEDSSILTQGYYVSAEYYSASSALSSIES